MRNDSPTLQTPRRAWWQPLEAVLEAASMPRVIQEMRRNANSTFQEMVNDLDTPMAPAFEREVARTLNRDGHEDLIPAETLMPPMMARFDLDAADFGPDEAVYYGELKTVCNKCPAVGRCWRALRAEAGWEKCRAFCPNAAAFEQKTLTAA
jgi:hypothetical protein